MMPTFSLVLVLILTLTQHDMDLKPMVLNAHYIGVNINTNIKLYRHCCFLECNIRAHFSLYFIYLIECNSINNLYALSVYEI